MGAIDNLLTARLNKTFREGAQRRLESAMARTQPSAEQQPETLSDNLKSQGARLAKAQAKKAVVSFLAANWPIVLGVTGVAVVILLLAAFLLDFTISPTESQTESYIEVAELGGCNEGDATCALEANCRNTFEGNQELIEACLEINLPVLEPAN